MCRRPGRKIWRHWAARVSMSPSRCRWQDPRERMNRYTWGQFHCRSCRRQARCGCNRLTGLHSGYTFRAYPPSLWLAKANLQGSRELVEGGVALFPYRRKAPAHCPCTTAITASPSSVLVQHNKVSVPNDMVNVAHGEQGHRFPPQYSCNNVQIHNNFGSSV